MSCLQKIPFERGTLDPRVRESYVQGLQLIGRANCWERNANGSLNIGLINKQTGRDHLMTSFETQEGTLD